MDKFTVDWEPVLWVAGFFVAVVTGLLSWIVLLIKSSSLNIYQNIALNRERLEKHESWILTLQRQVDENQKQTQLAIQAITINQDQDRKRFETFDKEFADRLIEKIRAITPEEKKKRK